MSNIHGGYGDLFETDFDGSTDSPTIVINNNSTADTATSGLILDNGSTYSGLLRDIDDQEFYLFKDNDLEPDEKTDAESLNLAGLNTLSVNTPLTSIKQIDTFSGGEYATDVVVTRSILSYDNMILIGSTDSNALSKLWLCDNTNLEVLDSYDFGLVKTTTTSLNGVMDLRISGGYIVANLDLGFTGIQGNANFIFRIHNRKLIPVLENTDSGQVPCIVRGPYVYCAWNEGYGNSLEVRSIYDNTVISTNTEVAGSDTGNSRVFFCVDDRIIRFRSQAGLWDEYQISADGRSVSLIGSIDLNSASTYTILPVKYTLHDNYLYVTHKVSNSSGRIYKINTDDFQNTAISDITFHAANTNTAGIVIYGENIIITGTSTADLLILDLDFNREYYIDTGLANIKSMCVSSRGQIYMGVNKAKIYRVRLAQKISSAVGYYGTLNTTELNTEKNHSRNLISQSLNSDFGEIKVFNSDSANIGEMFLQDGKSSDPPIKFAADTTTGIYMPMPGALGIVAGGTIPILFDDASGITCNSGFTQKLQVVNTATHTCALDEFSYEVTSACDFTLPILSSVDLGRQYYFINNSGLLMKILSDVSDTIEGAAYYSSALQYKTVKVIAGTSTWFVHT
jgi:hypothetical protein